MPQWLTEGEIYIKIELAVKKAGSAKLLAEQWGISPQFLVDVRKRRRNLTKVILDRMGIEKVVKYRLDTF